MEIFARRLKELRLERKLTKTQLAKNVGLSFMSIYQWENELRVPNGNAIVVLAKFFNVTTDYLLGLSDI